MGTKVARTGDPDFMVFPILAMLAKKPMTTRELSREMRLSRTSVYKRLWQLEEQGMVVKRAKDNKWMSIVKLVVESQTGERVALHGEINENFTAAPKPTPPKPNRKFEVDGRTTASPAALRAAKHFRVPATIRHAGEASVGAMQKCSKCDRITPLKYGSTPTCPICARGIE